MSRVCHAPCETACRGKSGEPLNLRGVKRFVVDWGREHGVATEAPRPAAQRRGRVAVVGSGPAGLTGAYFLAQLGYQVIVFEKEDVPGGMLSLGIPAYRLPRQAVAADIEYVKSAGVEIQTGVIVGEDISLADLFARGFQAVFLATGATASRRLDVPGIEWPGVVQGLELLRAASLGKPRSVGSRVVVIGGGNVAVDSAMSALRLGADDVTIVCLESLDEMPAYRDQVEDALDEGVTIKPGWGPRRMLGSDRGVNGVELVRCESVFDDWGAFHPAYCQTDVESLGADTVIVAIGQAPDLGWLGEASSIAFTDSGAVEARGFSLATSIPGVFAGGDAVSGDASVVEAMAAGKLAAHSIDSYLIADGSERVGPGKSPHAATSRRDRFRPFIPMVRPSAFREVAETTLKAGSGRASAPKLRAADRRRSFAEITGALTREQAEAQARACLKHDLELEEESAARLAQMGPAAFVLEANEDRRR